MLLAAEQRKWTSEAIDFVRFPLAVMVVFIHTMYVGDPTFSMPTDYGHLTGMDVCNLVRAFGTRVFTHIAVPTFFLISGYLFYKRLEVWDWSVWKIKMQGRLRTLVIPYFVWCLLFVVRVPYIEVPIRKIAAFFVKGKPFSTIFDYWETVDINWLHVFWDSEVWGGTDLNWLGQCVAHVTGPALVPFWFMRDLMVVILLSPFVFWLVKRLGLWFVGLIGLFYVSGVWPDIHGLRATSLFYFSFGAWFTIKGHTLCSTLYKYRWGFYIPYLILLPLMVYMEGEQTYGGKSVYIMFGVMACLCFCYYLVKDCGIKANKLLAGSSFFVFAFHVFVLYDYSGVFVQKVIGTAHSWQILLAYIVQPLLAVAICVLVYYCLHRWLPTVCRVLTGGR